MFLTPLSSAITFVIQTLFALYSLIVLLRLILQFLNANYYNPITQLVIRLTDPVVLPLRRVFPGFKGIDLALVALLIILSTLKLFLVMLLHGTLPSMLGLPIWILADLIRLVINLYFYAILIQVILSWLAPTQHHPVLDILYLLTTPILRPVQRLIPPIAGFDLTPLFVLIGLQVLSILIATPLIILAGRL